jgi:3-oxoacyl-[acyl-carrier protein] reductase
MTDENQGRLAGKTALIAGGASGFGKGIAMRFAREGALVDINEDGACQVAAEIGGATMAIHCDITQSDQVKASVQATLDSFDCIDILVNNACRSHPNGPLLDVDEEAFQRVYDVSVKSIFHYTHAVVTH